MHLRAPQRSEGPTPGTFGRDGAKGKRGVRSWAKAGQRRVGPDRRLSGGHAGRCARATSRVHRRTTATRRSRPLWCAGSCILLRTPAGRLGKFCPDGHEIRRASSTRPQIAPPSARRAAAAALDEREGGALSLNELSRNVPRRVNVKLPMSQPLLPVPSQPVREPRAQKQLLVHGRPFAIADDCGDKHSTTRQCFGHPKIKGRCRPRARVCA